MGAGAGLGAAILAQPYAGVENADLFLLTAVVAVAVRWGLGPALAAVVAASLAYNFFFIEPRLTFMISAQRGVITVLLFLGTALLAGRLAAKLRTQVIQFGRAVSQPGQGMDLTGQIRDITVLA